MKEAGFFLNMMLHALFLSPPFLFSEQYGEGEMSQVVIFVSVYYFFAILICTYYLSSGIWLSIIIKIVWPCLDSFHLPSFRG